jgi:hypothetical protein
MTMKEDEIREVMAAEKSRGARRPKDPEIRRQERELLEKFRKALDLEDERDFVQAIRELGLADDPQKVTNALKVWRAWRRV